MHLKQQKFTDLCTVLSPQCWQCSS